MSQKSFTGVARRRETRASVKVMDELARFFITFGGIGTIVAVTLICAFLVVVVIPLFLPGELAHEGSLTVSEGAAAAPVRTSVDEYRVMAWVLRESGEIQVYRLSDGSVLKTRRIFGETAPSAVAFAEGSDDVAFGFEDGSVVLGTIGFATRFLDGRDFEGGEVPEKLLGMEIGQSRPWSAGMTELTPEGQYRLQSLRVTLEEPTRLDPPVPVRRIDYSITNTGSAFAALGRDGRIFVNEVRKKANLFTGKTRIELFGGQIPPGAMPREDAPDFLGLSGLGDNLYLVWRDGFLVRFNTRDATSPFIAEQIVSLLGDNDANVTSVRFMNGKTTLLVGDSKGRARAWFPVKPDDPQTRDGSALVMAHELEGPGAAVTSFGPSIRTQLVSVGYADGHIRLFHLTTRNLVAQARSPDGDAVLATAITPKEDGVLGASGSGLARWNLDCPHPDITLGALFLPVWYDGYEEPEHVWQSTGGTDDFEPKLGMVPLIFGTLKGTLYAMLFGLPLALLAAIFSSEFLSPKVRGRIKPTVEVMASLPSVVLGFLGALVIAPFAESFVPACLASFLTLPFTFLLGAYLWQLLPQEIVIRHANKRFLLICACVPVGVLLAALVGPLLEDALLAGDLQLWLDGQAGGPFGGWFFLLLPVSAVFAAILLFRFLGPVLRSVASSWDRGRCALFDLSRFGAGILLTVLGAAALAGLLSLVGADPRGSVIGTYVQRNALVVGFVMGFAIIPIIYTIADDALTAVPEHLRSASIGTGATPWQTATRIIVPTAASGLFSAVMIGLGRAVGETMIVLMAAGNTPIMEWNVFNGFRTLSANLAVELPEAPIGGTHYRTLFLAALVLFVMTFILNTVAESVRQRFRRRAFEL